MPHRLCCLLLVALPACAAPGPPEVLISDAESAAGWSGVQLIDDAKVGAGAVRFAVPAGRPAACTVSHAATGYDFTRGGELRFWYRLTGTGRTSLFVKVLAYPFADGHQATWLVADPAAVDGQWRQAVIDLASAYLPWGEGQDRSRTLHFRTDAGDGSALVLDLDDVRIVPRLYRYAVANPRVEGERLRAEVTVASQHDAALRLSLRAEGMAEQAGDLPAGGELRLALELPIDAAAFAALPALERLVRTATLGVAGQPGTDQELTVSVIKPLDLPAHPRLLATAAELTALRERAGRLPWLAGTLDSTLRNAENWLAKPIDLPPRGGQWWHWYADPETGETLQTVSPTEHRNPRTGRVFTGYPYDDVVLSRDHDGLAAACRDLAFAGAYLEEARYTAKAKEILLAYAAKYADYPLHDIHGKSSVGGGKVGPQTLDESVWLIPMAQGADLVWPSLTESERAVIESGLLRPAVEVIRQHKMGIHNIQCWKNSAVGLVGLLLGDDELVADAIGSPHGFREQIARGVSFEGQWYEGAWGYHWYTLMALLPLTEAGERCGLGLYGFAHDGRSLRRLFDGPLDLAMPDGRLPAFNDSGTSSVTGQIRMYEVALARYGDPRYAEILRDRRGGGLDASIVAAETLPAPPLEAPASRVFPASGYAILRAGDGPSATWLCLKFGPHGGGHGHPDKNNFVLYARGQILGYDPGTTRYGVPLQSEWYRTSLAHNTLTVDGADQRPATGKLLTFGSGPGASCAVTEAGDIYDGVTHRRAVALFGHDLVLILDQVEADRERTLDIAYHHAGAWLAPPTGEPVTMPDARGYKHLQEVVAVTAALPGIRTGEVTARVSVVQSPGGAVWAGTGVGASTAERIPVVLSRQKATRAVVGWTIALDGRAAEPRLVDGGLEARWGGRTYRLEASPDGALRAIGADATVVGAAPQG